jgi:hypothetical protein
MLFILSSDVLAYVCAFLPTDRNVVTLFICCKTIKTSQFLTKVDLKEIYQQSNCDKHKTLCALRNRIRLWNVVKNTDDIPTNIRKLSFEVVFNQNIDCVHFPSNIYQVTFGYFFNQNIDNVLFPSSLQQLTFGVSFNQNMDNVK